MNVVKRVYLAGPMRGIPQFNFPAFYKAAADLRSQGYEVFSPAEADHEIFGADFSTNATGNVEEIVQQHGFDPRVAIKVDVTWIIDNADAIALLPGWENSKGARVEKALADYLYLETIIL